MAPSCNSPPGRCAVRAVDELRKQREEEQRQLGVQEVHENRRPDDAERGRGAGATEPQVTGLAQRPPRDIQQVGDSGVPQQLEREPAGAQKGCCSEDGCREMRHDAERAADCCGEAGSPASADAGGNRVENAGARGRSDDESGDPELEGHAADASPDPGSRGKACSSPRAGERSAASDGQRAVGRRQGDVAVGVRVGGHLDVAGAVLDRQVHVVRPSCRAARGP